jgi:hypothetical protein
MSDSESQIEFLPLLQNQPTLYSRNTRNISNTSNTSFSNSRSINISNFIPSSSTRLLAKIEHANLLSFTVFPFLAEELNICGRVSKKWNESTSHPTLWHELCKRRQMRIAKINTRSSTNWKSAYQNSEIEQTNFKKKQYKNALLWLFGYRAEATKRETRSAMIINIIFLLMFILPLFDIYSQSHRFEVYNEKLVGNITSYSVEKAYHLP